MHHHLEIFSSQLINTKSTIYKQIELNFVESARAINLWYIKIYVNLILYCNKSHAKQSNINKT